LTPKTRLVVSDARKCEEAIFKQTREKRMILQVLDRLPLCVQQRLYSVDDLIAVGEEQLEKLDVRVERRNRFHQAKCRAILQKIV